VRQAFLPCFHTDKKIHQSVPTSETHLYPLSFFFIFRPTTVMITLVGAALAANNTGLKSLLHRCRSIQYRNNPPIPINSQSLPTYNTLGSTPCTNNGGHAIFPGYNGHMGHSAANIRDCCADFAEQRAPTGMRNRAYQNIAFINFTEIIDTA
jgi:hypothetical protein